MANEVHVKDSKQTVEVNVGKDETKSDRAFSEYWFTNSEIFPIPRAKQRNVILNPGVSVERTKVVVPGKGQVPIIQKVYLSDLPISHPGRIIATTGFRQGGQVKPKPMGKHYELFEDRTGHRIWVNPNEYVGVQNEGQNNNKQFKGQVPKPAQRSGFTIAESETTRKVLGGLKVRPSK